ncbi:hypothetical protein Mal15_28470 [Stieleria maiorica]|uniref:Uncharacterized protein n=2 Tax=Stieleria maiorica TaxID=2795974 RepID=A0A5B9MBW4_9BACT|nr:hypothetical protein Mal15_28470 [Stieleria maiorica]
MSSRLEMRMRELIRLQNEKNLEIRKAMNGQGESADVSLKSMPRNRNLFPVFVAEQILSVKDDRAIKLEGKDSEAAENLFAGSRASPRSVPGTPILRTKKLRGVVSETGPYEYAMKAYLTSLEWEGGLRRQATIAAERFGSVSYGVKDTEQGQQPIDNKKRPDKDDGAVSWIIDASLRQTITVDEFGLIHSIGTWARSVDEFELAMVFVQFQKVLDFLAGEKKLRSLEQ